MSRVTSYGTYGTELATKLVDRLYKADGTKRAVIFCHGLNGQAWNPVNYPDPVIDEMVARGYPVFSPALGGTATWGNDIAQQKIADAKAYMQSNMGAKSGGALLWAGSMGTLASLNFFRNNPTLVAAVAVGLPAVDMADIHDNNRSNLAISIETAYGGAAGYTAALPTHNPAQNTSSYIGQPIKLWYSSDDPIVIPSVVANFSSATGIPTADMGAMGHAFNPSFASNVADFLETYN